MSENSGSTKYERLAIKMAKCTATVVVIRKSTRHTKVSCHWHKGHPADGSSAFAFHGGRMGSVLVTWTDGDHTVLEAEQG